MADDQPNDQPQTPPDGQGKTPGGDSSGAGTDSQPNPADEKTFTQAEVDAMFQKRLSKAVKSELKKLTGERDGEPTVDEFKSRAEAAEEKARTLEAKEAVRDYLADPKNKIGYRPENIRAIEKLVLAELEYDDEGKASNLKDAITTVKLDAPGLFLSTGSANGGAGRNAPEVVDMNAQIRHAAGR